MKSKTSKTAITDVLLMIGGALVADRVSKINIPMVPERFRSLLPVAAGFMLAKKGSRNMKALGAGMMTLGGLKTVGALVPQLGISGEIISGDYEIMGATDYALSGGSITEDISSPGSYALAGNDDSDNSDFNG